MITSTISLTTIEQADIKDLTAIMKRAFDEDTRIHLDKKSGGPTGYDDGSFLLKWAFSSDTTSYKVYMNGTLCGGILLFIKPDHNNYLGNIFLDTDMKNKGIGTLVWKKIEAMYPDTITWNTDTPIYSRRNHNFYINKCGFHCIKIENPTDLEKGSYILRKVMK